VLSEITGVSGLRILDAILAGQREPMQLAQLCHGGVKSSKDTIAKALEGDYRPEHIFALKQSLQAYRFYQEMVAGGRFGDSESPGRLANGARSCARTA
jgi:hypothetical protein